jgi:16S rRNA (adenine1518-N6/adenine1519-N6)-dimethyltransferase
MNLYSIKVIKELLKAHETTLKKHLGQNFLLEKKIAAKMLAAAQLSGKDTVYEIGPGLGTLTKELAQNASKVTAIEKDPAMVKILKETIKDLLNVEIIQADALKVALPQEKYKVVANLPYYLTSPLIRMFLEARNKPELMVFMVQKEIAQRICAKPSTMSILAVSVQFYAKVKIVSIVSKNSFWPRPKVDSAIIQIVPKKNLSSLDSDLFFRIVKIGFKQPRKQLGNNLSAGFNFTKDTVEAWLGKNNLQSTLRAQTLSVEDWVALTKSFPKT